MSVFHPRRCNRHLLGLGQEVKKSLTDAGIIGYQFGTVGVSDGISMGTRGMSYSLQSRDLIADQVETAAGGHWLDGMVVIPGCDKNMPGVLMACECRMNQIICIGLSGLQWEGLTGLESCCTVVLFGLDPVKGHLSWTSYLRSNRTENTFRRARPNLLSVNASILCAMHVLVPALAEGYVFLLHVPPVM